MPALKRSSCAICQDPLGDRPPTAKICGKAACTKERNRLKALKWGKSNLWGLVKKCSNCGKDFNRSQSRKKFCSDNCAIKGWAAAAMARKERKGRR